MASNKLKDKNLEQNQNVSLDATTVVRTDVGAKDGQNKCPKCGSTDISLNTKTGKLRCNFCRYEFEPEKVEGLDSDISALKGQVIGSGAQDIIADTDDVVTLKCSSCGAEVVIDTAFSLQARCHWCRNTLSINQQIPNGSVPDVVLPFKITKEEAKKQIEGFVAKRKFFAHPKFKEEFTTENIMGVYFPYMIIDVNSHAKLVGQGEELVRRYTRGSGDDARTYYDANLYHVEREFDLSIYDLTVESSSERLNKKSTEKTNNVINAIMPFDTDNCVKYNANYLKGYTSEKRDTNIDELKTLVGRQSKDIARFSANDTLRQYDRGVRWSNEEFDVKGSQWKAAYLPVWLYSYQQVKGNNKILHYVAVNARTKEVMGSVPIHMPKLFAISCIVELVGFFAMLFIDFDYSFIFLLSGFLYFWFMYSRYRNSDARHKHETETKSEMKNLQKVDDFIKRENGLSNSMMDGANNTRVSGEDSFATDFLDTIADNHVVTGFIKDTLKKEMKDDD